MLKKYHTPDPTQPLGKHWTVDELWLIPSLTPLLLYTELIDILDAFADHFGQKPQFTSKNSLYCLSAHSKNSRHYKGMAADFYIPGVSTLALAQYAEEIGAGGIGVYKDSSRHIHVDVDKRRCWWIKTTGSNTPGFGGVPVTFKKGHRSPAIREMQRFLNKNGLTCGSADGVFGEKTQTALKEWQRSNGLTADGAFGTKTNEKMELFQW